VVSKSTNYKGGVLPITGAMSKLDESNPLMAHVPKKGEWPRDFSFDSRHQNDRIWVLTCPQFGLRVKAKEFSVARMKLDAQVKIIERLYVIHRLVGRGTSDVKESSKSKRKRRCKTAAAGS